MPRTPDADAAAGETIDAILRDLSSDKRRALEDLRATIAAAAPDALEAISYGLPAYRYRGRPLVSYHAAKGHCAFFPMSPAVLDRHRDELAGFDLAKGTIRFTPDWPIPADVVRQIVEDRLAEIDAATGARRRG
jgi:uncharacterized protein YdhG (YjbR/CyaY superfamily)